MVFHRGLFWDPFFLLYMLIAYQVVSFTQPLFDYCDLVCGRNLNKGQIDRLHKLQNRATRITNQGCEVRSFDILPQLKRDCLAVRRDRRLCLLMYDVMQGNSPAYLRELFDTV